MHRLSAPPQRRDSNYTVSLRRCLTLLSFGRSESRRAKVALLMAAEKQHTREHRG